MAHDFEVQARGFAESSQKYYVSLQAALVLLRVANCPDIHCNGDGSTLGSDSAGQPELLQCQWCAERKELLDG